MRPQYMSNLLCDNIDPFLAKMTAFILIEVFSMFFKDHCQIVECNPILLKLLAKSDQVFIAVSRMNAPGIFRIYCYRFFLLCQWLASFDVLIWLQNMDIGEPLTPAHGMKHAGRVLPDTGRYHVFIFGRHVI
jgi:hypothetical protein